MHLYILYVKNRPQKGTERKIFLFSVGRYGTKKKWGSGLYHYDLWGHTPKRM